MVLTLRLQSNEIPEVIVGGLTLGYLVLWFWFYCVHEVWKLYGILNEENRNVVADKVPITLFCVELHGKATDITNSVL